MNIQQLRPRHTRPISVRHLLERVARAWPHPATVVRGDAQTCVTSVSLDSNDISNGDVFVAVPGARRHGAEFAAAAFARGAAAVITDQTGVDLLNADADFFTTYPQAVLIMTEDVRAYAGHAAAAVWDYPHRRLRCVGITGTNGKTTTSHLLAHALETLHGPTLLIGTAGITLKTDHVSSERTSVEAPLLHRLLAWAVENGARSAVMEVSSHALVLHRIAGIHFEAVAFLNLQRDHLDFHSTMEEYFAAKASLFSRRWTDRAVVCVDDQWGQKLATQLAGTDLPALTVCTRTRPAATLDSNDPAVTQHSADVTVEAVTINVADGGSDFTVTVAGQALDEHCPLPGVINVQNQVVALATLTAMGFESAACARLLAESTPVPGRMEVIARRQADTPLVIVDFAHTSDALTLACAALDPVTEGKLWCVFGATGERDEGKRPLMGQAAASSADVVIITDDDVYGEDPAQIRAQVAAGIIAGERSDQPWRVEVLWEDNDRAHAITLAVCGARPEDTVLIAGRGHETIQTIGGQRIELDDRECARQALTRRRRDGWAGVLPQRAKAHQGGEGVRLQSAPKTWEDSMSPTFAGETESTRKHP